MSHSVTGITGWIFTILLVLFFASTAILKIVQNKKIIGQTSAIGINAGITRILGLIELLAAILFIVPRTGVVGALLLIAYVGGVMATALQRRQPLAMFVVLQVLIWMAAVLRFPELGQRLLGTLNF
jgi:hypothetical protein